MVAKKLTHPVLLLCTILELGHLLVSLEYLQANFLSLIIKCRIDLGLHSITEALLGLEQFLLVHGLSLGYLSLLVPTRVVSTHLLLLDRGIFWNILEVKSVSVIMRVIKTLLPDVSRKLGLCIPERLKGAFDAALISHLVVSYTRVLEDFLSLGLLVPLRYSNNLILTQSSLIGLTFSLVALTVSKTRCKKYGLDLLGLPDVSQVLMDLGHLDVILDAFGLLEDLSLGIGILVNNNQVICGWVHFL